MDRLKRQVFEGSHASRQRPIVGGMGGSSMLLFPITWKQKMAERTILYLQIEVFSRALSAAWMPKRLYGRR